MPSDGINEAGLFISSMALDHTKYPQEDSRQVLNRYQWIQYHLDNFSTVEEVIASDKDIRLRESSGAGWHVLVSDSRGNCAAIEFIDGKMVDHTGETMPVKVLANTLYDQSLKVLSNFKGFGGYLPARLASILINCMPNALNNSVFRFVASADMVKKFEPQTSKPVVDYAFDILSVVAEPKFSMSPTLWGFVYDVQNSRIYFRTAANGKLSQIDFTAFDFSCFSPVKVLDINNDNAGDVAGSFVDYTGQINRDFVENWRDNFLINM